MHLQKINEITNHRITEGSEYLWDCFPDARTLDYESDYAYISVIYSTKNQQVYEATVSVKEDAWDEDLRPYRYINNDFKEDYMKEHKKRKIKHKEAYDGIEYIDLEVEEDFLEKAENVFNGRSDFDKRVQIEIELEDDLMLQLCLEAHKRDITLNQLIEEILKLHIGNFNQSSEPSNYYDDMTYE